MGRSSAVMAETLSWVYMDIVKGRVATKLKKTIQNITKSQSVLCKEAVANHVAPAVVEDVPADVSRKLD